MLKKIRDLLGTRLFFAAISSVPVGIVVGLVEIGFGYALLRFLEAFQLVTPQAGPHPGFPFDMPPTVLLISIIVLQLAVNFANSLLPPLIQDGLNKRVRDFISIQALGSKKEEDAPSVAEVSNILTNLIPKTLVFFSTLTQCISATIIVLTILAGMALLSLPLTGMCLGCLVLLGLPFIVLRTIFQKSNVAALSNQWIRDLIRDVQNMNFLRIVGTRDRELHKLVSVNLEVFKKTVKYVLGITANSTWPPFMGMLMVVAMILMNDRYRFVEAALLVPFVYLMIRLAAAMARVTTSLGHMQFNYPFLKDMIAWRQRMAHRQDSDRERTAAGKKVTPERLIVDNLAVGRSEPLVENLSFRLNEGDFLLISGKSGKGKTTLLMTLIGILPPLKGRILWNDTPINDVDLDFLRNHVGYSGADPFLFDDTVTENLLYGSLDREKAKAAIPSALEIAQCSFIYDIPDRLDHTLREGGEGISAGQKQRLSIARALLRNPRILLLDEATSGIDEPTEETLFAALRARFPKTTVIAVSHRNSLKKLATHEIAL